MDSFATSLFIGEVEQIYCLLVTRIAQGIKYLSVKNIMARNTV
jgi:hypothetical protein